MSSEYLYKYGQVGIIGRGLLEKHPKLIERLKQMTLESFGSQFDICSPFGSDCKVDIAFYFDYYSGENFNRLEEMKDDINVVMRHLDRVTSFLSIFNVKSGKTAEIYNVCTDKKFRGKGHMVEIFRKIETYLRTRNVQKIWLGIDLNNPMWDSVLKFYVRSGFRKPKITKSTSEGNNVNLKILRLVKDLRIPVKEEIETTQISNELKKDFIVLKQKQSNKLYISSNILKSIRRAYMSKQREYAGMFFIDKIINDNNNLKYYNMVYPLDSEVAGSWTDFIVFPPKDCAFSFHTHPEICYRKIGCYIGWPSGPDMAMVVSSYDSGLRQHFVITVEGVFSIQMNREFINFWKRIVDQPCKEEIIQCVLRDFSSIEGYRSVSEKQRRRNQLENDPHFDPNQIESKVLIDTLKEYDATVNNFSFYHLIRDLNKIVGNKKKYISRCTKYYKDVDDFKIFKVQFADWRKIEADNFFIVDLDLHKRNQSPEDIDSMFLKPRPEPEPKGSMNLRNRYRNENRRFYFNKPIVGFNIDTFNTTISANPLIPPGIAPQEDIEMLSPVR